MSPSGIYRPGQEQCGDRVKKSDAIIGALKGVTKKWAKQRKREEREASAILNRGYAMRRYHVSIKDAAEQVMEKAYLKASANGTLPALARQIMYAARPEIQNLADRQIGKGFDQYFTQTLLPDYMEEHGTGDWNVVYDARGHFQEPHTKKEVALGTIGVRNYLSKVETHEVEELDYNAWEKRYPTLGPEKRFGAVLFIEKEGFMPLFDAVKLAERYDIAIMSTKGMSVTASRELVDSLCGEHDIPLLVLHDFDKAGFSIIGTLRRDTRRYMFMNNIDVIDLGLRIDDINGLSTEEVYMPSHSKARLNLQDNGATDEEIEFLLSQRVELNAFASDEFVAWIEGKLEKHGVSKIIPKDDELATAYRRAADQAVVQKRIDEMLEDREAGKEVRVPDDLTNQVKKYLNEKPKISWDRAVKYIVLENFDEDED